jgi:6-phosphogluconolactonase
MTHHLWVLMTATLLLGMVRTVVAGPAKPPTSGRYWVYIGTFTSQDGSKGIYRCELDVQSGKLTEPILAAEMADPTFLAISPNGKCLYAVGSTADAGPNGNEGTIHAFKIDANTGELAKLNLLTTGGGGPCHLSVNHDGRFAIVANYGGGSSALFRLKPDGSLDKLTDIRQHEGKSVHKERQAGPHAHCALFTKNGAEYAYVVDLGLDKVFSYKLDDTNGVLMPTQPAFVKLPDGCGPRHIAFHPNLGQAYVCGELDSTVITLRRDGDSGLLKMFDGANGLKKRKDAVLSTAPNHERNSTAEILVHPDNGHVIVSNRGHDSLAIFKITATETTAIGHFMSAGDSEIRTPRNFNIDPTGQWILIANQDGGTVQVAKWSNGAAKLIGSKASIAKPVCITFLAKP